MQCVDALLVFHVLQTGLRHLYHSDVGQVWTGFAFLQFDDPGFADLKFLFEFDHFGFKFVSHVFLVFGRGEGDLFAHECLKNIRITYLAKSILEFWLHSTNFGDESAVFFVEKFHERGDKVYITLFEIDAHTDGLSVDLKELLQFLHFLLQVIIFPFQEPQQLRIGKHNIEIKSLIKILIF